ncbi:MAG: FAD-dependent oxidoreductase [Nitrospinae bacterium]|nr:FAD-dependent oxidoreductase [Nitrospinota bacterium]
MGGYDYDLIILGGGAAGFVAAKVARGFGKSVAMVEKGRLGGECTNFGCIPSKTLIRAARAVHEVRNIERFGLRVEGPVVLDTKNVMRHVRSTVQKVYDTHLPASFEALGINLYFGAPRFLDNHRVQVGEKTFSGGKFILATGASPSVPPITGINDVPFLTNNTIFGMEELPGSLIVLGGGPIGVELASAFNRLGVKTTVVEALDSILFREDRELAGMLAQRLRSEGLQILTSAKVVRASNKSGSISITLEGGGTKELVAEALLVASGRRPNTEGLDLEKAGVRHDAGGVVVNDGLQTSAKNIYACGDVTGPYRFSHMSEYQAVIACRNAFLPFKKRVDYTNVIWATFTDPELAHAGLTEEEARALHGDAVRVLRHEYGNSDKARTESEEFGRSKIILDGRGNVLGAHILGANASDVIHEVQLARQFDIPFSRIWEAVHIYPSYADVIRNPSKYYYGDELRKKFLVRLLRRFL